MKKHLNRTLTILLVISLIVLSSCSSKPSESKAREDLSKRLEKQFEGKVELIDFEKVNAVDRELLGQKMYIMEYNATLRALEECLVYSVTNKPTIAKKGEEIEFSNTMTYMKTEEGWIKAKESIFE